MRCYKCRSVIGEVADGATGVVQLVCRKTHCRDDQGRHTMNRITLEKLIASLKARESLALTA